MRDRFKIFIIDEVHRLSKNAFDALLKSIEEPPPYVKFMMATTELHHVPVTIQSRSQVFELRALPFAAIRAQLAAITTAEGVAIDDGALALVARAAEGSMRDALSSLDQILAFTSDAVTAADVSTVLGLIGRDLQFDIAEAVAREDAAGAFALAATVVETGFDLRIVCRELARLMRDLMIVRIDPTRLADPEIAAEDERDRLKALVEQYSREDLMRAFDLLSRAEYEIRNSSQPRHHFEMALIKWIHLRQLTPLTELIASMEGGGGAATPLAPRARPSTPAASPRPVARAASAPARPSSSSEPRAAASRPAQTSSSPASAPATRSSAPAATPAPAEAPKAAGDLKTALLASIREQSRTFYGMVVAQAQKIEIEGNAVVFTFAPVHKTLRTQLGHKRAWVEQLAQALAGRKMTVVDREAAPAPAAEAEAAAEAHQADLRARVQAEPAVQAVLDVFGGQIEDVEEID
jgi:DNA polymerase-3 subunit gamma/tau